MITCNSSGERALTWSRDHTCTCAPLRFCLEHAHEMDDLVVAGGGAGGTKPPAHWEV